MWVWKKDTCSLNIIYYVFSFTKLVFSPEQNGHTCLFFFNLACAHVHNCLPNNTDIYNLMWINITEIVSPKNWLWLFVVIKVRNQLSYFGDFHDLNVTSTAKYSRSFSFPSVSGFSVSLMRKTLETMYVTSMDRAVFNLQYFFNRSFLYS